jgi:hypothetical protein
VAAIKWYNLFFPASGPFSCTRLKIVQAASAKAKTGYGSPLPLSAAELSPSDDAIPYKDY